MKKADVKKMNTTELLAAFHWVTVRSTNEQNSRGGITQKTLKEMKWITEETIHRFDLSEEKLRELNVIF